jgi:hypothetical protein
MTPGSTTRIESTASDSRETGAPSMRSDWRGRASSTRVVQAWARAFHELRADSTPCLELRESDKERIACLESIIAVLIEKNERIRRQLFESLK